MFIFLSSFYFLFTQIMSWAPGKLLAKYWHIAGKNSFLWTNGAGYDILTKIGVF